MKIALKMTMIVVLVIMFTSCCNCRKGSPKIGELENTTWQLIELTNKSIDNSGISIRFDANEKMIRGTAPCNNFFGGFSLSDDKNSNIKIGNVGATRKFCPDSENEDKFAMLISTVTKVQIEGDTLLMMNPENEIVAILVAQK